MNMKLKEMLKEKSDNGRISCSAARDIAEGLGISYKDVGRMADELGMKIIDCQLGCF